MTTDMSERGLESLIVQAMTGRTDVLVPAHIATETSVPVAGGTGWLLGDAAHYNREYCVDLVQLRGFIRATQGTLVDALALDIDGPTRSKFLARLQAEITRRGVIDVLRHGIRHGPHSIDLFYGTPSPENIKAIERFACNRFSVTRQLRYSADQTRRSLDLALFINGLPIATFELKNSLTRQTVADAIQQYRSDRDPREHLFDLGRCVVHFAVDDQEIRFCTHLKGKDSWFLPFNMGWNDGAGNPPNPDGLKTDFLWKRILTREGLTHILENYAQIVQTKNEKTGKKKAVQLWPRYHQLDVVQKLLEDVRKNGVGQRYLIQHSAGSGKSNSIAWLAHQLIGLNKDDHTIFDSIIVVTDRCILDQQIRDTIKQFAQVSATMGHAERSGDLRSFLQQGKKIIITTVQKFPFIMDDITRDHLNRRFAIIIDEAHSSQGGRVSAKMNIVLSESRPDDEDLDTEDRINRIIEKKKMLPNVSYFAFTATPKNKTLEVFGMPEPAVEGKVRHRPFHCYSMKQAIEEGFILDVLRYYTPVKSYYRLVKKIEDDPEFDTRRAQKKLRRYVEGHEHAIQLKAEIMVDHFHEHVLARYKIGGCARAMVVTSGIERAIQYFHAIRDYLKTRRSPWQAIVAFSGEHEYAGKKVTESSLNGFPSSQIADRIREDPYRFLICADKFQTGYDEPLLHTMYVDKILYGIKAVQTLSRLNRSHPRKSDVFILDFMNDEETIKESFADYYRTTILSEETDPDKLHDLKAELDGYQVYSLEQVDRFVELFLGGADRSRLDPILDHCRLEYLTLDEDGHVEFKGKAKAFIRTYGFLSSILRDKFADWEKLSIFLNFLVPKLPAPKEEDLSKGIIETIDMDSYRIEKQKERDIRLQDADAEIDPFTTRGGQKPEPALDRLSNIIKEFNAQFSSIQWTDADRVHKIITEEIPVRVAADPAYQNAIRQADKQNARIEHDKAVRRVITNFLQVDTELFKLFSDDESFRRRLLDMLFGMTYMPPGDHNTAP